MFRRHLLLVCCIPTLLVAAGCGRQTEKPKEAQEEKTGPGLPAVKDVKVVTFKPEIIYAGVIRCNDAKLKILQLSMTVQTTKDRVWLGNVAEKPNDVDGVSFEDFQILLERNRIVTAQCLGNTIVTAMPPDGRIALVHLLGPPHMWEVDVFFAVPADTSQVKFVFGQHQPRILKIAGQ